MPDLKIDHDRAYARHAWRAKMVYGSMREQYRHAGNPVPLPEDLAWHYEYVEPSDEDEHVHISLMATKDHCKSRYSLSTADEEHGLPRSKLPPEVAAACAPRCEEGRPNPG
jgi:hypothetical protein